jgi:hypothetical protein
MRDAVVLLLHLGLEVEAVTLVNIAEVENVITTLARDPVDARLHLLLVGNIDHLHPEEVALVALVMHHLSLLLKKTIEM